MIQFVILYSFIPKGSRYCYGQIPRFEAFLHNTLVYRVKFSLLDIRVWGLKFIADPQSKSTTSRPSPPTKRVPAPFSVASLAFGCRSTGLSGLGCEGL